MSHGRSTVAKTTATARLRRLAAKRIAQLVIVAAACTGVAFGYFSTSSLPGSNGAAAAATVGSGNTPSAVATAGGNVAVSWSAVTMSNGFPVTGYLVTRYDAATHTAQPMLANCNGTITATSCTESSVPDGTWVYSVTALVGSNWSGAASAMSAAVTTDSTPPANSLSLIVTGGNAFLSGNTVYYVGANAGSFTIKNTVTDSGSGPASSTTSTLTGQATGWSHTPSKVPTPTDGPFLSNRFSWAAGTSVSPTEVVTGRDAVGNATTTTLTFVNDSSGPSGGSVAATGLGGTGAAYSMSTTLHLALDAGSDPNGLAASGAKLLRATAPLTSTGGADGVCGTFGSYTQIATDPAGAFDNTVADLACYRYQYVVTDVLGNATTYTSSAIKVDSSAPAAPTFSFAGFDSTYWAGSGSAFYYRPAAGGSITATAVATDPTSGIAAYSWPALGSGWTTVDQGNGSVVYSYTSTPTIPGTKTVTATNNAGRTSAGSSFTATADSTAPTTGTVSYANTQQTSTSIQVTFTTGTDSGSGIGSRILQRASATLTGSTCGSFGSFASVATNPTSPYTDVVGSGSCYKYRYVVSDNVGNSSTATSANVVKVSTSYFNAITGTAGLINYWRLGGSTYTSDSFTGSTGTALQSHTGEVGASWTKNTTISTGDAVITRADRIRKNGYSGFAEYYSSATPDTPDYTVSADLTYLSGLNGDVAAVAGRIDTSVAGGTFYAAGYSVSSRSWTLYAVVNGSYTTIGSYSQTLSASSSYQVMLAMSGNTISLLVDGVQRVTATNNAITGAGRAGVVFGNGTATYDTDNTGMALDNLQAEPAMTAETGGAVGSYVGGVTLGQTGAFAGDPDTAATFDGVDGFGTVDVTLSGDFSVEFSFKSTQGIGGSTATQWWQGAGLVDADVSTSVSRDWGISLRADGKIMAGDGSSAGDKTAISTTGGYNDGAWHLVDVTRSLSTGVVTIYVDGTAVGSVTGTTTTLTSPTVTFGRIQSGGNFFAGSLDDVSFYSSALSAATISNHAAAAGH